MDLNWWTLEDVWRKLQSEHLGELADDAKEAIEKCYGFLQETIGNADEGAIYGVNTGFGDLAHARVDNDFILSSSIARTINLGTSSPTPQA